MIARSFTVMPREQRVVLGERSIELRQLALLGRPRVDVLLLNLAIDEIRRGQLATDCALSQMQGYAVQSMLFVPSLVKFVY